MIIVDRRGHMKENNFFGERIRDHAVWGGASMSDE